MTFKQFFGGFKKGMHEFGETLAVIVNTVLLSVVYIVGVGVTSVVAKIAGKHFLEMKIAKKQKSYWSDLDLEKKQIDAYYRQF